MLGTVAGNGCDMAAQQRFWAKIEPDLNSGCWLWSAHTDHSGYGKYRVGQTMRFAHHLSWDLAGRGPRTDPHGKRLLLLHRCDTPACVNPDHLFLGTQFDNMADMVAKGRGRWLRGESNRSSKLRPAQVRAIRALKGQMTQQAIADAFGVTRVAVSLIHRGATWEGGV